MIDSALLGPAKVFELVFMDTPRTWRAFYRTAWHNDNPSVPNCNYRSCDGATPEEAVERATAAQLAERLAK